MACQAAAVDDRILSFTDGCSTKVGDNDVKLSSGKLQRVAIAQAILKIPKIVSLYEVTSSVETDQGEIEQALEKVT